MFVKLVYLVTDSLDSGKFSSSKLKVIGAKIMALLAQGEVDGHISECDIPEFLEVVNRL